MTKPGGASPRRATRAAQALGWVEPSMRSIAPPIWTSASYERDPDGSYPGGHSYTRDQNPTYDQVEALLADLEGGAEALLFASGMAAAAAALEALEPGAHVLAPRSMYWTLRNWMRGLAARGRLRVDFVPTGDLDAEHSNHGRVAMRDRASRSAVPKSECRPP